MPTRVAAASRRTRAGSALPAKFYDRDTEQVARDLLGAVLRHTSANGVTSGRIVETEAYLGEHDLACHAAAGHTARTKWLYGAPGTAYVYFIYGVHWCFNAVTRGIGLPSAVLVRALEPLGGVELMRERRGVAHDRDLTNGPGKLCEAMAITGALNGTALRASALEILRGEPLPESDVQVTPRIGITKSADWPLRWLVKDNPWVSKTPKHLRPR